MTMRNPDADSEAPDEDEENYTRHQGILPRLLPCRVCKQDVETRVYTDFLGQSARVFLPHGSCPGGHFRVASKRK